MLETRSFSIIIFSLLFFSIFSCKNRKYDNSVFWKITNQNTKDVSYIIGTVHILDTTLIDFPNTDLYRFIEKSDIVCTEIVPEQFDKLNQKESPIYVIKEEHKIINALEKRYYNKLMKIADSSRYALYSWQPYLDSVRPSKITQLLVYDKQRMRTKLFLENNYSPEKDFIDYATKKNIQNIPLETTEQWISNYSYFSGDNLDYNQKLDVLKETIDKYYNKEYIDIYEKYSEQNLNILNKEMFRDSIMILRNIRMSNKIDSIIKIKSGFIAVGTAHLPYENGILNLLSEKGYLIEKEYIKLKKK